VRGAAHLNCGSSEQQVPRRAATVAFRIRHESHATGGRVGGRRKHEDVVVNEPWEMRNCLDVRARPAEPCDPRRVVRERFLFVHVGARARHEFEFVVRRGHQRAEIGAVQCSRRRERVGDIGVNVYLVYRSTDACELRITGREHMSYAREEQYEETMTRPVSFTGTGTFGGAVRAYTRQRLYRFDEADFNAAMHDTPTTRPPPIIRPGTDSVDPYEEGKYAELVEAPAAIDQFRADAAGAEFQAILARRRAVPSALAGTAAAAPFAQIDRLARQRRVAIVDAMARATAQASLFDVQYAACVPHVHRRAFLASVEISSMCGALLPALLNRHESFRAHLPEEHWIRALTNAGGVLESIVTQVLPGHLRAYVPPECRDWYTRDVLASPHAHHEAATNTTTVRILTFRLHTDGAATRASGNADDDGALDGGYRVRVVAHLVGAGAAAPARQTPDVLCFRAFQFLARA